MKAFLYSTCFLIFICHSLFAQSDSLAVVNAGWKKEKINPGVILKTFWFQNTLFNSNQFVSILEIKQRKKLEFDLGYDPKKLITTSDFGKQANAIAALNGTFFDIAKVCYPIARICNPCPQSTLKILYSSNSHHLHQFQGFFDAFHIFKSQE